MQCEILMIASEEILFKINYKINVSPLSNRAKIQFSSMLVSNKIKKGITTSIVITIIILYNRINWKFRK